MGLSPKACTSMSSNAPSRRSTMMPPTISPSSSRTSPSIGNGFGAGDGMGRWPGSKTMPIDPHPHPQLGSTNASAHCCLSGSTPSNVYASKASMNARSSLVGTRAVTSACWPIVALTATAPIARRGPRRSGRGVALPSGHESDAAASPFRIDSRSVRRGPSTRATTSEMSTSFTGTRPVFTDP